MDQRDDLAVFDERSPAPGEGRGRRAGYPVDPFRLLAALRKRWLWLLLAAILAAPVGYLLARTVAPPRYEATATLVYEGVPSVPGLPDTRHGELQTLVDSVTIAPNLEEAAKRRGLKATTPGLKKAVEVSYALGSNVFEVTAKASEAKAAADLANTVVEVFQEHRRSVEKARLEEHLASIDLDLRLARENVARAREGYDEFREKHGIADLSAEQEQAIVAAADLRAAADLAQAEAQAQNVRLKQLRASARRMRATTVLSSTRSMSGEADLAAAQTKLAAARAQLSDDHPRVRALEAQVRALSALAREDVGTVSGTVVGANPTYQSLEQEVTGSEADHEAARVREESLAALTKAARERVAQLSRVEGEASALLASVQVAETHQSNIQATRARIHGAAQSPVSGFRVVAAARPPEEPASTTKSRVIMAGVPALAVFLVLVFVAIRELKGFRVATPAEVAYWGMGPVVGTTTWPRDPRALDELVSELDDQIPRSWGRTLVVPARPADRSLVAELACRLSEGWHPIVVDDEEALDDGDEAIRDSVVGDAVAVEQVRVGEDEEEPGGHEADARRAAGGPVTALVPREPDAIVEVGYWDSAAFDAKGWVGPDRGPRLRRAARLSDRVLVVVGSRSMSAFDLRKRVGQLGRRDGIGFVVVGADEGIAELPDRVGNVNAFWTPTRSS